MSARSLSGVAWLTREDLGPSPAERDRQAIADLADTTGMLAIAGRVADRITDDVAERPRIQRQAQVAMLDALVHTAHRYGWKRPNA